MKLLTFRNVAAFVSGALATAAAASVLQTQLILHEVGRLGPHVDFSLRAAVTAEDLARFAPVMFAFALAAAAIALAFQGLLRRVQLTGPSAALMANVIGLAVVLVLLRDVIPIPALAATRTLPGVLMMSLTAVVGACVSHLILQTGRVARGALPLLLAAVLLLPAASFLLMRPTPQAPPKAASGYQVQTVLGGLERPWSLAQLPDGRVLVTEMAGRLRVINPTGATADVSMANVPTPHHNGRAIGLMEVALSPRFSSDRRIYLTMGYREARGVGVRLVGGQLHEGPDGLRLDHVGVLFESTPKRGDGNNGGRIAFLDEHTLLITIGDGNVRREEAQNPASSLGKVMRIDLATATLHDAQPVPAVVHSMGHRNPQGIVRDPVSGQVFVTEHGPRGGDELNRLRAGGNYGWPLASTGIDYPFARVSPFTRIPGMEDPELQWSPSIAPSGLAVYQGAMFPHWQGDFLVPALRERGIRRLVRQGDRVVDEEILLAERGQRIRDVRVAADGSIFVLTDGVDAELLRLTPKR